MPNLSFRGWRELSTDLHFQQKDQDKPPSPKGSVLPLIFPTANIEPLSKNCYDRVQPIIHSTKLQIIGILPRFLRYELTPEYRGFLRPVVLPPSGLMLRCRASPLAE